LIIAASWRPECCRKNCRLADTASHYRDCLLVLGIAMLIAPHQRLLVDLYARIKVSSRNGGQWLVLIFALASADSTL
jgi:hypothetical protein